MIAVLAGVMVESPFVLGCERFGQEGRDRCRSCRGTATGLILLRYDRMGLGDTLLCVFQGPS